MKKSKYVLFLALITCLLVGCKQADTTNSVRARLDMLEEKRAFTLEVTSTLLSSEECYICGDRADSPMRQYGERDGIGIVYWNSPGMVDTDIVAYDNDGKEIMRRGTMSSRRGSFGDGYGAFWVHGTPDRGISEANIYYGEDDEVDFEIIKEMLCQDCLDKVVEFYCDNKRHGADYKIGTTGYCLVDYQTKELYTLSAPFCGYCIRDYVVSFSTNEKLDVDDNVTTSGTIELLIFYAPLREER